MEGRESIDCDTTRVVAADGNLGETYLDHTKTGYVVPLPPHDY
jgi:hypothetical protein